MPLFYIGIQIKKKTVLIFIQLSTSFELILVLEWIMGEISGDHTVEVVTDAMLDRLVAQFNHVAVLFYDKDDETSEQILEALVPSYTYFFKKRN